MAEPPVTAMPHLPGYPDDEFSDFTHRDYRPNHVANPTRPGVPYDAFMSPQKAGSLLCKVARKSRGALKGRRGKVGKTSTAKPTISHGRK